MGRTRAAEWTVGLVLLTLLAGSTALVCAQTASFVLRAYWTLGAAVVSGCVVAYLVGRRYTRLPPAPGRVLCIVPVYNEPAENLVRTVRALVWQTVPVDIVVIDDGSHTPVVPTIDHPRVRWLRQDNTGKRGAQAAVLRRFPREAYDFVLTVDSDSQPHPDAVEHLLRAMSDRRVQAATGMIYVRNHQQTWVSMATDLDIGSSCVMMRASRSMLGALETTSGALALYRSALLYDHLDDYAVECGTGDDRWLALRALRRGEVVGVAEAHVDTLMPTTLRGTYRQRVRWARSWWWMLPYVFRHLRLRQLLSPLFGLMQLIVSPIVLVYAAAHVSQFWTSSPDPTARLVVFYLLAYIAVRYALSALYLIGRPSLTTRERWTLFFVGTPLAIVLNLILLTPIRYFALTRLFDNRWQTRLADPNTAGAHAPGRIEAGPARATARVGVLPR
jgi:cellulose synthase/poly-beta-1,6-N-acetylglucosamine synthase-like glycosyltransferase